MKVTYRGGDDGVGGFRGKWCTNYGDVYGIFVVVVIRRNGDENGAEWWLVVTGDSCCKAPNDGDESDSRRT